MDLKVTGVLKSIPSNSSFQFDLLAHPLHYMGEARLRTWSRDCPAYVMLAAHADPETVNQKIVNIINEGDGRTNNPCTIEIRPLKAMHLYALSGTDPVVYVYLLSIVAVIVLLIACINYMNLSTARSFKRAREVGLRKVVGACRGDIIRQFFAESLLLAFLAVMFGLLLVKFMLPVFNNLSQKDLTLNSLLSPMSAAFLVLILLGTALISGSYPALYLSAIKPISVMKMNSGGKASQGRNLRKFLLVFQYTAAVILIISTIMIYRQMHFIQSRGLGFNREQIVAIRMNRTVRSNYPALKERLRRHQDNLSVSAASSSRLPRTRRVWCGRARTITPPSNCMSMNTSQSPRCLSKTFISSFN